MKESQRVKEIYSVCVYVCTIFHAWHGMSFLEFGGGGGGGAKVRKHVL